MLTGCVSDVASVSDTGQTGRGRMLAGRAAGGPGKRARQLFGGSFTVEAFAVRGNLKRSSQLQEEWKMCFL